MRTVRFLLVLSSGILLVAAGCSQRTQPSEELAHYALDDMDGVITQTGVELDKAVSSDAGGSLHLTTTDSTTVSLFETGDLKVENARLIYSAKIRTQDLKGKAYLEMWCHFPGKGEYFSRGLTDPLTGSQDWSSQETSFFLKKGEDPDQVKLNLVVTGPGEVWIDDLRLVKAPLP